MEVQFYDDAAAFLTEAGPFLERHPLRHTIVATTAGRLAQSGTEASGPRWFAVVRDGVDLVGVVMRTHPEPPHAGFVPSLPEAAVAAVTAGLAGRGERVSAWNGDLDAARALCAAAAEGAPVQVVLHTRLFELHEVVWPRRPEGALRQAGADDEDLVAAWVREFRLDSEVQGGRTPDPTWQANRETIRAHLAAGSFWLWEMGGSSVHLTGVQPAMFGVSRIGPVYTPAEQRGRGYAAWVVAVLSQRLLDAGVRPCLYTDQANPVSNEIYQRIGYVKVRDEGNVVVADQHMVQARES
ncbi:GNAT family N-acetyltransferase [Propioniciclava sp.]|uniref:GNAT family N-acetyltransferase n=1 Tax=Propioniciclava sp. TaxID=2038686 RepID=UPI00261A36F0|nr:GNAT family N-acetyltransferase [Propioniciclava sp.]